MYFKLYKDLAQRYCFLHTYSIYCITIRNDDDKKNRNIGKFWTVA